MAQAPQKDIQAIIDSAAEKEGVDAELLRKIGGSESSHKATAKNPKSTAKGLFQFVDKTWKEMGGKPGEQFIPEKNAELGARYVKQNQQALAQALGRDPSYGEVYAAHVFGPTGAKALLTKADPNAPIEQSLALFESPKRVQKVLKQNPNLQGKTTAEVLASLDAKMGSKPQPAAQEPTPKSSPGWFRSPVPHFIRSEAPNLGTGYNAALALMGMSDKDELEKAQELVAQEQEDNAALDFGQAKQMLANVQAPNAFAKQQPRMLASGGYISVNPINRATVAAPITARPNMGTTVNIPVYGDDGQTYPNAAAAAAAGVGYSLSAKPKTTGARQQLDMMKQDQQQTQSNVSPTQTYQKSGNVADMLAQMPNRPMLPSDVFSNSGQRFMAQGGEVRHMADGGFMVPFQTNILRQPDKQYLDESQRMWDEYNAKAASYNQALDKYNTEIYNPYTKQIDAYNAALKAYNESAPVVNYNAAADAYNKKVEAFNAAPWNTIATQVYYGGAPGGPGYLGNRYVYYRASGPGQEQAFQPGYQFVNTNPAVPYFGNIQSKSVAYPGEFTMKAPDPFGMTAPTAPKAFDQTAPTTPSRSQEEILAYQKQAVGRAQEDARNRGLAIDVANDPNKYNFAGFGSAGINAPSMFNKGGEAKKSQHDSEAEKLFDDFLSAEKNYMPPIDASIMPAPPTYVEGLGVMNMPPAVSGRVGTNFDAAGGNVRIGATGTAMQTPDKKIMTIPGMYDVGYNTNVGPGNLDLSFQKEIKAIPGREKNYAINARYSIPFADGGEAVAEPEKGSAKALLKEVGRSTQYAPADIAGSPVDLINLGLQGVDALTGSKLAQNMPVGGSEWIIKKANELGLMDKPTGSTTENLTRMGMGIVSPAAGPRAVATAGKAVKGAAKSALEDLSMAATGQGGSPFAQKFATVTGIEPMFASRPKGGVSLGASSAADVPLTNIDEKLKQIVEGIDTNTEQGKAVAGFFDKKLRNYYQNQHGTADDPLFKAILEGRIQPPIANPQVIDQARAGDPKALTDLRNAYDASTNIQGIFSKAVLKEQGKTQYDMEDEIKRLIKSQSPNETTLMADAQALDPEELKKYSALYRGKGFKDIVSEGEAGKLLRLLNKTDLQPHVRQAVAKGEPIYGSTGHTSRMLPTDEIRDYLFTRTPAEIKNMGVVDAAVKAKQWHVRMAEARKNPEKFSKKELFSGTEPVLPLEKSTWVDVKTPDALSLEGNIMGHCVGGSNYCNLVAQDKTKIISLRDKKGIPHVTIQLDKTPEGFTRVAQIKGTANNSPEKYFGEINAFLDDYSSKLGKNLTITERPSFVPPQWRDK